jgi:hypothetical protein
LKGLIGYTEDEHSNTLTGLWKLEGDTAIKAAIPKTVTNIFYTGDYDMHDLLSYKGGQYCRILEGDPEEKTAIDFFNLAMVGAAVTAEEEKIAEVTAEVTAANLKRKKS